MKKLLTLALLPVCAALLLTVSSCGKKSTTSGSGSGTVTLTYGGATHTFAASSGLNALSSANEIGISADESSAGHTLTLLITGAHTSGTYTYGPSSTIQVTSSSGISYMYSTSNAQAGGYSNGNMTFNISGTTATGTFSGTLYNLNAANDSLPFTGSYTGGAYVH